MPRHCLHIVGEDIFYSSPPTPPQIAATARVALANPPRIAGPWWLGTTAAIPGEHKNECCNRGGVLQKIAYPD